MKSNQSKIAGVRGGARPGAGRPKGSKSQKTREIADRAAALGITPLEFLLQRMRDEAAPMEDRVEAAKSCLPYIHPRLAAVEHSGPGGTEIRQSVTLEIVGVIPG